MSKHFIAAVWAVAYVADAVGRRGGCACAPSCARPPVSVTCHLTVVNMYFLTIAAPLARTCSQGSSYHIVRVTSETFAQQPYVRGLGAVRQIAVTLGTGDNQHTYR